MNLMQRIRAWLHPTPPPTTDLAEAEARHAAVEDETIRRLRSDLHLRRTDKELERAREELKDARARVDMLALKANVRGRGDNGRSDRAAG